VTLNFSGGTGPYTIEFNGTGGFVSPYTTLFRSGLAAGTYTWIVKDANGCTASGSEVVGQPIAITATDTHVDVLCNGASSGSVTLNFSGGTGTYTIEFNAIGGFVAQTSPKTYNGLAAGTYTWIVKDANGCTASGSEVVGQPIAITATDTHVDVLCNGASSGSVTLNFSGGTGTYTIEFNAIGGFVAQTSPKTYNGLAAGTYTWIVKDANGCTASGSEVVGQPIAITATDTHVDVLCNGASSGSVTLNFSGGTGPYTIEFNGTGGFVAQTSPKTYNGLAAGTYTWIVKDANGCTASGSEVVGQPIAITATDTHVDVLCNGASSGSVTLNFSGGTGTYTIEFNAIGGFVAQTSPKTYNGLAAGTYTWIVKDANGCTASGSEVVGQPIAITATDTHVDVLCNGASSGSVTLNFSGGTGTYTIEFNAIGGFVAQTSPKTYNGLAAGTYTWIVKDANGCTASGSEVVGQPIAITATDTHVDVLCNGASSGSVTLNFSGGTGTYTIEFNAIGGFVAQTSPKTYNGLAAGTYTWIVKDANGCTASGSEVVGQPIAITATDTHVDVLCNGASSGSVTLNFSGGTGTYTIEFNAIGGFVAQTSPKTYNGLAAGTYTWIVKDANGCTASGSEVVGQPIAITATDTHVDVLCNGASSGSVTLNFSGDTGPYTIEFNGTGGFVTQTSPKTYNGLAAGTYTWIVKDANGCTASGSEVVGQPIAITATDTHVDVLCNGASSGSVTLNFSGGTGPYTIEFNGTGGFVAQTSPKTYNGLAAEIGRASCREGNGCTASGSEVVGQPIAMTATDTHVDVLCNGASSGSVTLN